MATDQHTPLLSHSEIEVLYNFNQKTAKQLIDTAEILHHLRDDLISINKILYCKKEAPVDPNALSLSPGFYN